MRTIICALFISIFSVSLVHAETQVQRLLAAYESVTNLTLEIRRDTPLDGGKNIRMLSRVYFQRPDKLHVENFSPVKRRTISDGAVFRQYTEGASKGFSRPVEKLDATMLTNLRMLPGSNANFLEPLRELEEVAVAPTAEFPLRVGYDNAGKSFTVLSFDSANRLAKFEIFSSPDMTDSHITAVYSNFQEVAPNVWLARTQEQTVIMQGFTRRESVRLDTISATAPIPASLFDASAFFKNVEFVDSFDKIVE